MNTKKEFKFFNIVEYEKEQDYLNEQHKNGWKLTYVTFPGIYHFEQCKPENVIYQLDYNPDRQKSLRQYIQMFEDCGWNYVCDFVGYSYFYKSVNEMNHEEEIFNDDFSKKDMLDKIFKSRVIPLFIIFGLIICPNLIMQLYNSLFYKQAFYFGLLFLFSCLFILYVSIFIRWFFIFKALKKKK